MKKVYYWLNVLSSNSVFWYMQAVWDGTALWDISDSLCDLDKHCVPVFKILPPVFMNPMFLTKRNEENWDAFVKCFGVFLFCHGICSHSIPAQILTYVSYSYRSTFFSPTFTFPSGLFSLL